MIILNFILIKIMINIIMILRIMRRIIISIMI